MKKINNQGFSLVELLVTSVLIVVVASATVGVSYIANQAQDVGINSVLTVESANRVIYQISRELRTARYGENAAYPIVSAAAQDLTFYSDIDFDGDSDRVRYYLEGTELKKDVIKPEGNPPIYPTESATTAIIAQNVRNDETPIFIYYDSDFPQDTNLPLGDPVPIGEVRTVQVVIITNEDPNSTGNDYILDTYVQIRLLKEDE